MRSRTTIAKVILLGLSAAFGYAPTESSGRQLDAQAAPRIAPRFEVDPLWPKPLPNHWILGSAVGVSVDSGDHVWIIHRPGSLEPGEVHASTNPPIAQCCAPAPPVLEFDSAGNLLNFWGGPGPGYDWPESNHGITVDYKGNVWIGGNGRGTQAATPAQNTNSDAVPSFQDNSILKFTSSGKFLMQIGKAGRSQGSNDVENLRLPESAKVLVHYCLQHARGRLAQLCAGHQIVGK